jgi:uncharacterized protein (DUF362 family)
MQERNVVFVEKCASYDQGCVNRTLDRFEDLFRQGVKGAETVVLKPNWIAPHHRYKADIWEPVITHPSLITGVVKKTVGYMNGRGRLIVTDGPQTDSCFGEIIAKMPVEEWIRLGKIHGVGVEVVDLRDHEWLERGDVIVKRRRLAGDPKGSVEFDLKENSEFSAEEAPPKGYYGADYDTQETTAAHTNGRSLYKISRTVVEADVVINLPKWKTHKKAGVTCALKNLVGINTYKNYLPHYKEGTPSAGGDQFPDDRTANRLEGALLRGFKELALVFGKNAKYLTWGKSLGKMVFGETSKTIRGGNWYGNDTVWRTILDLNKLLLYGNGDGTIRAGGSDQQKRCLVFVDGIISGQGDGPEAPEAIHTGIIIGGTNAVSVDCVAVRLMGFDFKKIPSIRNAFVMEKLPLADFPYESIRVRSKTIESLNSLIGEIPRSNCFSFEPHLGWKGHIELF